MKYVIVIVQNSYTGYNYKPHIYDILRLFLDYKSIVFISKVFWQY